MVSKSIHIPDMWLALQPPNPTIPGSFNEEGTAFTFPVVESSTSRGKKKFWVLRVEAHAQLETDPGESQTVPFNRADWLGQPVPQIPGLVGVIRADSWQEGGNVRSGTKPTYVRGGKNIGKRNATNAITQALRDALSRYNKHVKSVGTPGKGAGAATLLIAQTWRPPPMLVKKIGEVKATKLSSEMITAGLRVQRKFNGIRQVACLLPADASEADKADYAASDPSNSGVVLYSRTGGLYHGKVTLRAALDPIFARFPAVWAEFCTTKGRDPWAEAQARLGIAEGDPRYSAYPAIYLDGELYKHDSNLQWIQGQGCGTKSGEDLQLVVYDCFFPLLGNANIPVRSVTRQEILARLLVPDAPAPFVPPPSGALAEVGSLKAPFQGPEAGYVRMAQSFLVDPDLGVDAAEAYIRRLGRAFIEDKFEGAIVRKDPEPYQYGINNYHSPHLFKIKPRPDAEFPVVGYAQGTKGKDVGAIIWVCEVPPDRAATGKAERFNVVPKNMTYPVRRELFRRIGLPNPSSPGKTFFDTMFVGLPMTVEYPELSSKTGIPVQAKALGFRVREPTSEHPGGREDPAQLLLAMTL